MKSYSNLKITNLPASKVEIRASVSAKELDSHRDHVIEHIVEDVELPGFRKGHAPRDLVVKKYGEGAILAEVAEHVIGEVYPQIVTDEKIMVIDRPEITIEKLDPKEGLSFIAVVSTFPHVELPKYREIAKAENAKKEPVEVTEEEFAKALADLKKALNLEEDFNEENIKKLGEFTSLEDFKTKLKSNLSEEKASRAKDKKRAEIIDAILSKTEIELPAVLVEAELEKMMYQFKEDLARMGTTLPEYLKKIEKTEADIKKDWIETASKRVRSQIVINKIAIAEKITADKNALKEQTDRLMEMYPDGNRDRAEEYIETMLINEAVLKLLEE